MCAKGHTTLAGKIVFVLELPWLQNEVLCMEIRVFMSSKFNHEVYLDSKCPKI